MPEKEGMENIDPRIAHRIEKSEKDGGITLKDVPDPKNSIIEVHTQNSIYKIAIFDAEEGKIAMAGGKHLRLPEIGYLRGSTWGGSMMKIEWIGIGMHLEANLAIAGLLTTSTIKTIIVKTIPDMAASMRQSAESTTPKHKTKEEILIGLEKTIDDNIPAEERTEVKNIISFFCPMGRCAITQLLCYAAQCGKLDQAKKVVIGFSYKFFRFQAPEVRGNPEFTQANNARYGMMYQELGLDPAEAVKIWQKLRDEGLL